MGILDQAVYNNDSEVNAPQTEAPRSKNAAKTILSLLGVLLLIAGAVGGSIYVVRQRPEILGLSKNNSAGDAKEIEKYVAEVGKLILLPDETPTLATVTDLNLVKDQDFFKNAKEGDKVLIYTNAKKAYLYRPGEKRIIEVGIVNVSPDTQNKPAEQLEVELLPSLSPSPSPAITATPTPLPTLPPATPTTDSGVSPTPTLAL